MDYLLSALLILLLFLVTFPERWADISLLNNRLALWASGSGLLLACVMPNYWLSVFVAASSINLMLRPHPSQPLKDSIYWPLVLGGSIVLVVPYLTIAMVPYILGAIMLLGLAQSIYLFWDMNAGQGNAMHVQAIAAIATAACIGLAMQDWWLWGVVPAVVWPIVRTQFLDPNRHLTLGPLYLGALALGWLSLSWPLIVIPVATVAFLVGFLWAWPKSPLWSGRKEWWTAGLTYWWINAAWWQKLLGFGSDAWIVFSQKYLGDIQRYSKAEVHAGFSHVVMPHAHNDYVQILFDRGLIGLGALVGYILTSLWMLAGAGPNGQALFLVGVTLCAIAFGSFPWTGCVIAYLPDQKKLAGYGCPSLNFISWLTIVLIEVVRRA